MIKIVSSAGDRTADNRKVLFWLRDFRIATGGKFPDRVIHGINDMRTVCRLL